jgi:hypothetical protein
MSSISLYKKQQWGGREASLADKRAGKVGGCTPWLLKATSASLAHWVPGTCSDTLLPA